MEELITKFRADLDEMPLVKVIKDVGHGSLTITFANGRIKDIIPAPVYRTPHEVLYKPENTSVMG